MRILHLYKDYAPVEGGVENHIKLLAEAQAARGHNVGVLVTSRTRHTHVETINGVRVIFAGRLTTISSTPLSLAMFQWLGRERPDIVHLHFPYPWGEIGNYWFGRGSRTVLTYHSDIVRQKYLRLVYAPLMQRVLARVDRIIATSPNYMASSPVLPRWRDKCIAIPLGIDPTPFLTATPLDSGPGVRHAGAAERAPRLLFVGALRYYKGLPYLLRAIATLAGVRLTVIGRGPMEREWKELAQTLGLGSRVEFLSDVSGLLLPSYYVACDIFMFPSCERSEAFGLVQLEAMAAGKPVISTEMGTGTSYVNVNGETGLVVPPRDAQALAAAIQKLLDDPELRARMGAAGRERVLQEFTLDKMVDRVMAVYAGLLGSSSVKSESQSDNLIPEGS